MKKNKSLKIENLKERILHVVKGYKYPIIFAMMLLLAGCATVCDVDGNRYKELKINDMRWMAENLRNITSKSVLVP
ncbi:MAG: hypothetical protein K6A41_09935 [Bacteroidales bacterium]|nr:hypothetical protein [Bacteroidales bacterium]